MQQGDDDTSAGSTDRVTQSDSAAVDVDLAHVEVQLTGHGDGLSGEGFVGLDKVDVVNGQVCLLQSVTGGGDGAGTHDLGIHAALTVGDQLGNGLQAVLLHSLAGGQHDGGSAVVDAGGVACGDTALTHVLGQILDLGGLEGHLHLVQSAVSGGGEAGAELAQGLNGGAVAGELVNLEVHDLALHLDRDGNDLVVKLTGSLSGLGLLLGGGGELVQILTGDAPDVADVLSGGAHMVAVEGIPQTVVDHGVYDLIVEHTGTPAGSGDGIGSGGHDLGTAGHDDVGVAGLDGTGGLNDALHAGAADHAHSVGGSGQRQAGLHAHLTGHVLALTGGEDAAEHQLVYMLRSDTGTVQRLFDHDSAQLGGGLILQGAAEAAQSGTAAVHYIDVFHGFYLRFSSILEWRLFNL